ncbi:ABC transporter ATP-binding protein [bacterium]|nr:ABC transporter ATP-binding protein [bacterium]
MYAMLGANGAGKSTLQKLIRGSLRPSSGSVRVFGQDPCSDSSWRARLAWITDLPALHPRLTLLESLRFYAGLYGVQADPLDLLDRVGLSGLEKRYGAQLSRGQQQRLAWARALLVRAELLLLDEPTNGLDVLGREEIYRLIRDFKGAILLSTHDMREAQELAGRVGILHQGRLLAEGTPAELCAQYLNQELGDLAQQASLERVYRAVAGRSLYCASEE